MNRFTQALKTLIHKPDWYEEDEWQAELDDAFDEGQDAALEGQLERSVRLSRQQWTLGYNAGVDAATTQVVDILGRITRELTAATPDDGAE